MSKFLATSTQPKQVRSHSVGDRYKGIPPAPAYRLEILLTQ